MTRDRTTLVLTSDPFPSVEWQSAASCDSRLILVRNFDVLRDSLHLAQRQRDLHVVRVILDGSISAEQWLDFLSTIPIEFPGDILWIHPRGKAFLSAAGRSGARVLQRMSPRDVPFYLEAVGITASVGSEIDTRIAPTQSQSEILLF